MIRELLSGPQNDLAERARALAESVVRPAAARHDADETYPWEAQRAIRDAGLAGLWIPERYGGAGGGLLELCLVVEELSRACGGMGAAYLASALGSLPILLAGTEAQRRRWLPGIASGEALAAFALSEKEAGSDVGSMRTRAVREGDAYRLDGDKKWNAGGSVASWNTVFAVTAPGQGSRGISAFVVERGAEGYHVGERERTLGLRCLPVVAIRLAGCRVPVANLIGGAEGAGFAQAMQTLDRARTAVAAQAVGIAQGAFELALAYTGERRQFDRPVRSFQGVQWMLAEMATRIEGSRQLAHAAARLADAGSERLATVSAMAKLMATDMAMSVTTDAVQLFGGYGYLRDRPVEKYLRDAKVTQIYEGTNQIQRIVIARDLLRSAAPRSGG